MSNPVKREVVWATVIVFLLVNSFIVWNLLERRRRAVVQEEVLEDPIPMLEYGDGAFWGGEDIVGLPLTIPDSTNSTLILGLDLSQGHQTLERVRVLTTGQDTELRDDLLLILAAKGSLHDQKMLARSCERFARVRVVDRSTMHDVLGYDPTGRASWELVLVEPDGRIAISLARAKTMDLKVFLAQWFGWRWKA